MSEAHRPPLVARFEECTLPKAEWTHQAHLTVGLWYAATLPFDAALRAMREGILRLNAVHGVPTTPSRGYHETITRFYLHLLCDYVAVEEVRPAGDWQDRISRLLQRYGGRELPLRYYSKDRLMSPEARLGWVEPDLRPLEARSAAEPDGPGPADPLHLPFIPLHGERRGVSGVRGD